MKKIKRGKGYLLLCLWRYRKKV